MPVPHHDGMAAVACRYDAFILDVWGVLHDGVTLYPGAAETLDRLEAAGKPFVMLTNAPRRSAAVRAAMTAMGMPERHCRAIVSSGEATRADLEERSHPFYRGADGPFLHVGPGRDRNLFEGLGWEETGRVENAAAIVNTGPWEDHETVADYDALLSRAAARGLPMICANPDLAVVRGGRTVVCAGALAARYEERGGRVRYLGKPKAEIYDYCFRLLPGMDRSRLAAVGDSFATDLAGARNAGIDPILVVGGLHAEDLRAGGPAAAPDPERLAALADRWNAWPAASIPSFEWRADGGRPRG